MTRNSLGLETKQTPNIFLKTPRTLNTDFVGTKPNQDQPLTTMKLTSMITTSMKSDCILLAMETPLSCQA